MTTFKSLMLAAITVLVASPLLPRASAYYMGTVAANNPNLWYQFEDASSADGATMANSGSDGSAANGTYHDTVAGGVTLSSNTPYLIGGTSASFDGNGTASIPNGFLPTGSSARTIEGWFNNAESGAAEDIIEQGPFVLFHFGDSLAITADTTELSVAINGERWGISGTVAAANTWHYFAFVFPSGGTTGDDFQVYLDGSLVAAHLLAGTSGTVVNTQDGGLLGTSGGPPNYSGLLDEIAVYNTALTATQVHNDFESAMSVPEPASLGCSSWVA